MGGAQPRAVTMNHGVCLAAEVDPHRIQRRLDTRYLDESFDDIDAAIDAGLALRDSWSRQLILQPKANLEKVIRETFPVPEEDDA